MSNKPGKGKIFIIGIGPGSEDLMTNQAKKSISLCNFIVGYETYIDLIRSQLKPEQEIFSAGMTEEVLRAQKALELALKGNTVGVISSGDAGIYGMGGLVFEVINKSDNPNAVDVEIIPGITSISSSASLLGAPVMHDFCAISLSDHLTPWSTIVERLHYAAAGDFVVALYNPKSSRRKDQIVIAREIFLKHRDSSNPVGIVTGAYRENQNIVLSDLDQMLDHSIGMMTTIIIGNSTTKIINNKMITPRGYEKKYQLDESDQKIKKTERMSDKNEPWALGKNGSNSEFKINLPENLDHGLPHKYYIKTKDDHNGIETNSERSVILKHLAKLSPYLNSKSKILSGNDGRLSLYTGKLPEDLVSELAQDGLILQDEEESIVLKKCNFCEGEKTESIPWLDKLEEKLNEISVPGQINIGFNGCGMSCHGAVMEDIGIVYFRGEFEVYIGGRHMGRYVRLPLHVHKNLSGEQMLEVVDNEIKRFKSEGMEREKFFKYILRIEEENQ